MSVVCVVFLVGAYDDEGGGLERPGEGEGPGVLARCVEGLELADC